MRSAPVNQAFPKNAPFLDAIKISPRSATWFNDRAHFNEVTYYVGKTYVGITAALGEKRAVPRRRTRLRTGKIVAPRSVYLIECQIYDWSETGARLRLFTNAMVPSRIQLFEDVSERLINATIVWRRRREIGLRFVPRAGQKSLTKAQLACLRTGYNPAKA